MKLRLGTRGSLLALTQSQWVARRLSALGHEIEIVTIETAGDRDPHSAFGEIGVFGVFVREIERRLVDGSIDVAVHSFKDVPTRGSSDLVIAAVPERRDAADVLVTHVDALDEEALDLLRVVAGGTVGTSSARRRALLASFRPDLKPVALRGNVPTRLRKVQEGACDATILAAAGLARLAGAPEGPPDFRDLVVRRLPPEVFVPAPAQGALAVQVRRDRADVLAAVTAIDDARLSAAIAAERKLLARVEGGCDLPFGAFAQPCDGALRLVAALEVNGQLRLADRRGEDPEALAESAWVELTDGALLSRRSLP